MRPKLSPRFDDFITNPDYTNIEKSVEPITTDHGVSPDGFLHIEYSIGLNGKIVKETTYKIKITNISKEESKSLKLIDGCECDFYPHSDSSLKCRAIPMMTFYHKNNLTFHDGCTITVKINEYYLSGENNAR